MRISRRVKRLIYSCFVLLLAVVLLYSGLKVLEATVLRSDVDEETFVSKTISRGNAEYFPRQDITVVMVMGIDQYGKVEESTAYTNPGAADMVMLLVFDEKEEVCNVLCLNRDTMLEMPVLGVGGKQAGTYYGQLALAHTYGSGLNDSCENVRRTVSSLLGNIKIDYYLAMRMDAISILNDAVGGVTVTVEDDFSEVDATIGMGEVKLTGEQAINFVRTRKDVGDQLNISRIERQQLYIDGFIDAFREKQENNENFIVSAYEDVERYVVTDSTAGAISSMRDRYGDYEIGEVITPKGKNVMGEKYYEFYVDEDELDKLVLQLFYIRK